MDEPEVIVYTPAQSSACGYQFEEGQDYLVYAYSRGEDRLTTDTCTRTRKLADAQEDAKELGNGRPVDKR